MPSVVEVLLDTSNFFSHYAKQMETLLRLLQQNDPK